MGEPPLLLLVLPPVSLLLPLLQVPVEDELGENVVQDRT
jgi:hypothetical protein